MSSVLEKPSRSKVKKHLAVSLKPCKPAYDETGEGNDKFFTIFVDNARNQIEKECTPSVFSKIEGKRREKRPHTGLKKKTATRFLLSENKKGVIDGVDVIPEQDVMHSMTREDLEGVTRIQVEISPLGEISLIERPQDVNDRAIISLFREIDKVARLETGQSYGKFEVAAIDGNKVSFEYDGE